MIGRAAGCFFTVLSVQGRAGYVPRASREGDFMMVQDSEESVGVGDSQGGQAGGGGVALPGIVSKKAEKS